MLWLCVQPTVMFPVSGYLDGDCLTDQVAMPGCVLNPHGDVSMLSSLDGNCLIDRLVLCSTHMVMLPCEWLSR